MTHILEIATNAINVAFSVAIMVLLLVLTRDAFRQGLQVVMARLYLRTRGATRAVSFVVGGLVLFLASNVLELYGDVYHLDWVVNEIVETAALIPMIAGLAWYHLLLRVPSRARSATTVEIPEAPRG